MNLLSHDEIYGILRKSAKQDYWQTIYSQSKETQGLRLFRNQSDFTYLQLYFLQQIGFYSSLHFDISMNEVRDLVLENETYEDAYAYYRYKKRTKSLKTKPNVQKPVAESKNKDEQVVGQNQWVFTKVKGK